MLMASQVISDTVMVTFALINPVFELALLIFSSFVIKHHKNIFGLVIQLTYTYYVLAFGLESILKKLFTRNDNPKNDLVKETETAKQNELKPEEMSDIRADPIEEKQTGNNSSLENCLNQNFMAICSVIAIILTLISGSVLRYVSNDKQMSLIWTKTRLVYLGYPGELFLRILNCLVIPLIFSSLVYALSSLDIKHSVKIAIRISIFYFVTTFIAVFLGIVLVSVIKPGSGELFSSKIKSHSTDLSITDIFLDLFR